MGDMGKSSYQQEIDKRFWKRVNVALARFRAVFLFHIIGYILLWVLLVSNYGLFEANKYFSQLILSISTVEVVAILGRFFWWGYYEIPQEIHDEDKSRINNLETKFLYPDLKIEPLPLIEKDGKRYASLSVINNSDNKVSEFYGQIVGFRWIDTYPLEERVDFVNENKEPVSVGAGSESGKVELGINGGGARFNVVIGENNKLYVYNQKTIFPINLTANFEIDLLFRGEINGNPIKPIKKTYLLRCVDKNDGMESPMIVGFSEHVQDD
jgi:hypothetical protein